MSAQIDFYLSEARLGIAAYRAAQDDLTGPRHTAMRLFEAAVVAYSGHRDEGLTQLGDIIASFGSREITKVINRSINGISIQQFIELAGIKYVDGQFMLAESYL